MAQAPDTYPSARMAARAAGVPPETVRLAIKNGQLGATLSATGSFVIDKAELHWLFGGEPSVQTPRKPGRKRSGGAIDASRETAIKKLRYEVNLSASMVEKLRDALQADGEPQPRDHQQVAVAAPLPMRSNHEMGLKPSAIEQVFGARADRKLSAIERLAALREADKTATSVDAWRAPLERLRGGQVGGDGILRIETQRVFDHLEVPMNMRTTGAARRLAKIMLELGWAPTRVRGMTRGGFLEDVRG